MKVVIGGPGKTKVYDDKGNDLTSDLSVRRIIIEITESEIPSAYLECNVMEGHASLNPERVRATLLNIGVKIEDDE